MKRKILQFVCLCAILFTLTGCGFESVEEHDKKASTKTAETKKDKKNKKQNDKTDKTSTENNTIKDEDENTNESVDGKDKNTNKENNKEKATTSSSTKDSQQASNNNTTKETQTPATQQPVAQYVTVQIDVLNMLNKLDQVAENKRAYVPSDGWILSPVQIEIEEGDTAFSVLERVTRMYRIPISYQGAASNAYNTIYIQGIAQLFEFDCGQGSGWMYYVNGNYISVGSSSYSVKNGDVISWRYTCDNGKDM